VGAPGRRGTELFAAEVLGGRETAKIASFRTLALPSAGRWVFPEASWRVTWGPHSRRGVGAFADGVVRGCACLADEVVVGDCDPASTGHSYRPRCTARCAPAQKDSGCQHHAGRGVKRAAQRGSLAARTATVQHRIQVRRKRGPRVTCRTAPVKCSSSDQWSDAHDQRLFSDRFDRSTHNYPLSSHRCPPNRPAHPEAVTLTDTSSTLKVGTAELIPHAEVVARPAVFQFLPTCCTAAPTLPARRGSALRPPGCPRMSHQLANTPDQTAGVRSCSPQACPWIPT